MNGLHMRVLDDHVEAVITDDDVDGDWQLKDTGATLQPVRPQLSAIDAQLAAALGQALQTTAQGSSYKARVIGRPSGTSSSLAP